MTPKALNRTARPQRAGRLLTWLSCALMCLLGQGAPAQTYAQFPPGSGAKTRTEDVLEKFGIDPEAPVSIARFLAEGIPPPLRMTTLPSVPRFRVELFPPAMRLAVELDVDAARAPLLRLLQGDYSPGIERIVEEDASSLPGGQRADYRERTRELLAYNAANALSLMGETAALPLIQRQIARQVSDLGRVRYALAAASLGDREVIPLLLDIAERPNRVVAYAAIRALEQIAGESFDVEPQASYARRQEAAARARAWWERERGRFRLDPAEIRERRLTDVEPTRRVDRAPQTLRDHLIYASDYLGLLSAPAPDQATEAAQVVDQPRASRRYLGQLRGPQVERLAEIALDRREDIDIRLEAMRWLVHNGMERARPALKELRRDPDPEIATAADAYLER